MKILIIRLGALGDFVLSFAAFAALRAHHAKDEITLLTTPPFAELAKRAPWFDRVVVDSRPPVWALPRLWRLARQLRGFDFVYDLQTSERTNWYFRLAGKPPWSGIAPGCSAPHANPERDRMHTLERQHEQLTMAGIQDFPPVDLAWLGRCAVPAELPSRFALLVPGASAHRPAKRWPAQHYGVLARDLLAAGLTPLVLGSAVEAPLARYILAACPEAVDLTGQTKLCQIAALAQKAAVAIGNDTGPMHLIAAVGCPTVVLFSAASDPALTAPRGPNGAWPVVLRAADLSALPPERVAAAALQAHTNAPLPAGDADAAYHSA
jgi:ADP-heptose:LPS heptosyltransferase